MGYLDRAMRMVEDVIWDAKRKQKTDWATPWGQASKEFTAREEKFDFQKMVDQALMERAKLGEAGATQRTGMTIAGGLKGQRMADKSMDRREMSKARLSMLLQMGSGGGMEEKDKWDIALGMSENDTRDKDGMVTIGADKDGKPIRIPYTEQVRRNYDSLSSPNAAPPNLEDTTAMINRVINSSRGDTTNMQPPPAIEPMQTAQTAPGIKRPGNYTTSSSPNSVTTTTNRPPSPPPPGETIMGKAGKAAIGVPGQIVNRIKDRYVPDFLKKKKKQPSPFQSF